MSQDTSKSVGLCQHDGPCRHPVQCILPPYVLDHMMKSADEKVRRIAIEALKTSEGFRMVRNTLATMPMMAAIPSPAAKKHRHIYTMKNRTSPLPGRLVRSEGEGPTKDNSVNLAYDFSGYTYDFYYELFKRNSIDGRGMILISSVHYGVDYNNAFWNGEQMVYGDGDGEIFLPFVKSLDVVGHELTHGVVQHTCNLEYQDEPGALNEHFADVMGTLVKQWHLKQAVGEADWLIGSDIMGPAVQAKALRTFKAEKAYENDPILGTDPQPKHMIDKYTGEDDYGGVHINSGIPNHAFYQTALELGGYAWEKAGRIWYEALLALNQFSNFQEAADRTYTEATRLYGSGSLEANAVQLGWERVGITIGGAELPKPAPSRA